MKLSEVKHALATLSEINFKLPNGGYVPPHFHVTEVGLVTRYFIDCGGTQRIEAGVNFQLWEAEDYDHRLTPQKFLSILDMSSKVIGEADDLEIEVDYQQSTIGRFGLDFDGTEFRLTAKQTDCLAKQSCGISAPVAPAQNAYHPAINRCC